MVDVIEICNVNAVFEEPMIVKICGDIELNLHDNTVIDTNGNANCCIQVERNIALDGIKKVEIYNTDAIVKEPFIIKKYGNFIVDIHNNTMVPADGNVNGIICYEDVRFG